MHHRFRLDESILGRRRGRSLHDIWNHIFRLKYGQIAVQAHGSIDSPRQRARILLQRKFWWYDWTQKNLHQLERGQGIVRAAQEVQSTRFFSKVLRSLYDSHIFTGD